MMLYLFEDTPNRLGITPWPPGESKKLVLASESQAEINEASEQWAKDLRGYSRYTITFHTVEGDIDVTIRECDVRNTPQALLNIAEEQMQLARREIRAQASQQ